MNAIITGGAGFIGSYLSKELIQRGFNIAIWDNLFRGKYSNIKELLDENNLFFNIDMSKYENIGQMADLLLTNEPEYIFHYAAINGTQYFYDIPATVLETNANITYNLMLALREAKRRQNTFHTKIIYASSSEVYGEPLSLPSKETDITYVVTSHIRDSYAAAKLIGEFYVKLISEELGLEWITLRLFNVYGPKMIGTKYGQVIPEFIKRLSEGEYPLSVYGNGEHMRSFCYVTDNVNNTIELALSSTKNEIFNIGNDHEISILELGTLIMEKMQLTPKFIFLPEREGDHKRRCPDTTKIHAVIGPGKYISLEDGLEMMLGKH